MLVALLKLTRPRYNSLTVTPFVIGALLMRPVSIAYIVLGAAAGVLFNAATSVSNAISDREEDGVNCPQRLALLHQAGEKTAWGLCVTSTAVYLFLVFWMWWRLHCPVVTVSLWVVYIVAALGYSLGHWKRHTMGPPIILGALTGAYLWVGSHGPHHGVAIGLLSHPSRLPGPQYGAVVSVLILWVFAGTLCGTKDAPHTDGDAAIGYRSIYVILLGGSNPFVRTLALLTVPYVAATLLSVLGRWPGYWLWLLYPATLSTVLVMVRASTHFERRIVEELGFWYWQLFMSVVFLLILPTVSAGVLLAGSALWWLVMGRSVHVDPVPVSTDAIKSTWLMLSRRRDVQMII